MSLNRDGFGASREVATSARRSHFWTLTRLCTSTELLCVDGAGASARNVLGSNAL